MKKNHPLLHKYNHRCYYCGKKVKLQTKVRDRDMATVEHIWPKDDLRILLAPSPVVLSCLGCNARANYEFRRDYHNKLQMPKHWLSYELMWEDTQSTLISMFTNLRSQHLIKLAAYQLKRYEEDYSIPANMVTIWYWALSKCYII